MSKYEVSVPLFVLPFVEVEANDEKVAKEKAITLMYDNVVKAFPKCDYRILDSNDWRVTKINSENDKALELLKKYNVPTDNFKSAEVVETAENRYGTKIEYIYLDFDEELYTANLCYLRRTIGEKVEDFFLADTDGGYPSMIEEAKTYVWTDEDNRHFFLDDSFNKIFLKEQWCGDINYLRAVELNAKFDYEGIVVLDIDRRGNALDVRPLHDDKSVSYRFRYNEDNLFPYKGMRYEEIDVENM